MRRMGRVSQTKARSLDEFITDVTHNQPLRVPGTAVFLNGASDSAPSALVLHHEHNKTLHEKVILLHVKTKLVPHVEPEARATVEPHAHNFFSVRLDYGFMEHPDIPKALGNLPANGLKIDANDLTYYLGRQTIVPKDNNAGMALWREKLYSLLSRNATSTTSYFCLPANRVVEMVTHVEI